MSRILAGFAAFALLVMLALPGAANAAERRADGLRDKASAMTDVSSQRWRRGYVGRPWVRRAAWRGAAWGPGWGVRRAALWGPGLGYGGYGAWGYPYAYPYAYPATSVVVVRTVPAWGPGWGAWGPGWGPRWGWGGGWGRRIWW
jgi:hypothetical protein